MSLQAADRVADYRKRTFSGSVHPIGVVESGCAIERYADQKTMLCKKGAPVVVENVAVGLESELYREGFCVVPRNFGAEIRKIA